MGGTSPVIIEMKDDNTIKKYSKQNKKFPKLKIIPKKPIKNSNQLFNSICRIYDEKNIKRGIGFFMQIILDNKSYYFLVTCNNIITSEQIDKEETVILYFLTDGKDKKKSLKIDSDRTQFVFFKPLDITIIGIRESDNIPKEKFLYLDLNYKREYSSYKNKSYYIVGFDNNNKPFISSSTIEEIEGFEFMHKMDKEPKAFGSLICSKDNFGIIGINKEGEKEVDKERDKASSDINYGTFIGKIADDLENIRLGIHIKNDISMYQGYLNLGLRHGIGTGYYIDGGVYEGEWVNDARNGKGIMYYSNGNVYNGIWKNNRREGFGEFYFIKGCVYKGEFRNNIIDGFGEFKFVNGTYTRIFFGSFRIPFLDNPNYDPSFLFNH